MVLQPFIIKLKDGKETRAYVDIITPDSTDVLQHPDFIIKIVVTDIHTFFKEFKAKTKNDFAQLTFHMNMLTMDDLSITDDIIFKLITIKSGFRSVLMSSSNDEINLRNLDGDKTELTFTHGQFKYKFPLVEVSVVDQLELMKAVYSNLENFTMLQTNAINAMSSEINNKNQIIKKLAVSYNEKMNPFVSNSQETDIDNIIKSKNITQLFVNKRIFKYFQTKSDDIIRESLQNQKHTDFTDPKWIQVWEMANGEFKKSKLEESEDVDIHIEEFGKDKTEEEIHHENQNFPTQPKVKRKLQGLLRRQKKKNKLN